MRLEPRPDPGSVLSPSAVEAAMTGAAEWTWAGVAQAPGQLCSVQVHGARDGLTRGCGWVPRAGLAFAMEHHFTRVRGW